MTMETTNNYTNLDKVYSYWNDVLFNNELPEVMFRFDRRSSRTKMIFIKWDSWVDAKGLDQVRHEFTINIPTVSKVATELNQRDPKQWRSWLDLRLHRALIQNMHELKHVIENDNIRAAKTHQDLIPEYSDVAIKRNLKFFPDKVVLPFLGSLDNMNGHSNYSNRTAETSFKDGLFLPFLWHEGLG